MAWKLYCDPVNLTVYPLVHTILLETIHCNESLLQFKASGFFYTLDTGPSLYSSWTFYCCLVPLISYIYLQVKPLPMLQKFIDKVGAGDWLHSIPGSGPSWQLGWSVSHISLIIMTQVSSQTLPQLSHSMQKTRSSGASSLALTQHEGHLYHFVQASYMAYSLVRSSC